MRTIYSVYDDTNYHATRVNPSRTIVNGNGEVIVNPSYKYKAYSRTPNKGAKHYFEFNSTEVIADRMKALDDPKPVKKLTRTQKRKLGLI